jgi:hypothetical protein
MFDVFQQRAGSRVLVFRRQLGYLPLRLFKHFCH